MEEPRLEFDLLFGDRQITIQNIPVHRQRVKISVVPNEAGEFTSLICSCKRLLYFLAIFFALHVLFEYILNFSFT